MTILPFFIIIQFSFHFILIDANIIHSVLGVPSECVYQNVIRPCRLSFSCWIQGGKHVQGCGSNKWLFSCCIPDKESMLYTSQNQITSLGLRPNHIPKWNNPVTKLKLMDQVDINKNFLRRRVDENVIQDDCGLPRRFDNTLQKRIIGGRPAHFAEYPWQAHIRIGEFQCGGVLVSRNFVATAAHCIKNANLKDIVIYLGELDTQNSGYINEPYPVEKHFPVRKIVHPKFQFRMTQPDRYDLALLKLAKPAGYSNSDHIAPICLPLFIMDLMGRKGIIAGWGKTETNMGQMGTNILQTAVVPIISAEKCINWHESKQITVHLFDEMFCAGHPDGHQDACLGDSGGPLIVPDNGRFYLIGITSAGFGCGIDHQPGIYHNVQKTSKWIRSIVY